MQKKKSQLLTIAASLCLPVAIAAISGSAHAGPPPATQPPPKRNANTAGNLPQDRNFAQTEGDMTAKTRLFGPIGPGLRAIHRSADGRTYILASPSPGLVVYN